MLRLGALVERVLGNAPVALRGCGADPTFMVVLERADHRGQRRAPRWPAVPQWRAPEATLGSVVTASPPPAHP